MIAMTIGWVLLMVLGVPIAFSLGAAVLAYMLAATGPEMLFNLPARMVAGIYSFPLLAVPFFILAGDLMNKTGVAQKLVDFADALVGFLPGGLGQVTVAANIVMSGMSGSGFADAAATGSVLVPAMRKRGFPPAFAGAVVGAAATLGPLIPPSIPMVVYGVLTGASVGALFIGGIIPGLLLGAALMALVAFLPESRRLPRRAPPTLAELGRASLAAAPALALPVIVLGGIIGGIFTPTEAAVVATAYVLAVGFVGRTLHVYDLGKIFLDTALTTSVLFFIVGAASLFAWVLTLNQVPQKLLEILLNFTSDPSVTMFLLLAFILAIGCFMEMMAVLIVAMPLILPILKAVGIDTVHFGVVFSLGIMIGTITPPFGLVLFLICKLTGEPIGRIAHSLIPFYVLLSVALFVLAYVPQLVLYLPNLLFRQ